MAGKMCYLLKKRRNKMEKLQVGVELLLKIQGESFTVYTSRKL